VFDVLPAQIIAPSASVIYALSCQGKWVLFDAVQQEMVLHGRINDRCFFFLRTSNLARASESFLHGKKVVDVSS